MPLLQILLYFVFFASALLLILIILLQEGKGGGLGDAFGGAGAETFGPRAGGINRFTFGLFGAWVLSAMLLHWTAGDGSSGSVMQGLDEAGTPPPISIEPQTTPAQQPADGGN